LREDLTMQLRYTLAKTEVSISPLLMNCNNVNPNFLTTFPTPSFTPNGLNSSAATTPPVPNPSPIGQTDCYADGETSLAVKKELASGPVWTSAAGYGLTYNLLDNVKDPTTGLLIDFRQDFAGLGGNVKYIRSSGDLRYYFPVVADIVGTIHGQAGIINGYGSGSGGLRMLDQFQMGPNLVRGFAPSGIGPRDLTPGTSNDALGGTKYWGASAELQMPFWFLPKEIGLKGSLFADAGSLWDWDPGTLNVGPQALGLNGVSATRCWVVTQECLIPSSNNMIIRSSVGAGLIWSSPFGPLRFDFAFPLTKASYDRKQWFRFGGGTSF
jgi:outer membrane protein insertion porin family